MKTDTPQPPGAPLSPHEKGGAGKTLYRAALSDPRERAAQPREAVRGRAARRAEETSDVTRFRGVLPATLAGAFVTGAAALLLPPAGGHTAPGPLSRPHVLAKLECAACHVEQAAPGKEGAHREAGGKRVGLQLDEVCRGCHGEHGSTRPGHQRAIADGALGCATCHPIHRGDQGVVFSPLVHTGRDSIPSERPIRFAPGAEVEVAPTAFRPAQQATVAIVTAGSCTGCHDVASPRDPVTRCFVRGQEALGDARPAVCFDEHQVALPEGAGAARAGAGAALPRAGRGARQGREGAGVCSGQHTEDRAVAWEAAREVVAAVPVVPAASVTAASAPVRAFAWIGAGLGAAGLVLAGVHGGRLLRARRRKDAGLPKEVFLRPAARVRLPQIDASTCIGCYACVDACPYDVLTVERYVAVVSRPEACCGLVLCEQRCPNGSLKITDGAPIADRPRLGDDLASADVAGLYLAGDITGLPLIKNAIHQGAQAAIRIAEELHAAGRSGDGALDLIIVGAGPAGISAALRAKELGLSFEVIEQGSVAQSIRSFPRGKLVFDQPLELPTAGKLWLKESTKEELLSHWLRIVRQERLPIVEETRMVSVRKKGEVFVVSTEPSGAAEGSGHGRAGRQEAQRGAGGEVGRTERRARRVLLAIGQRGTPRRLSCEVSAEVDDRVHYHLADARSFAGRRVLVVGLGDVAMEAALALARQPGTAVTIAYRGSGFRRGKGRNIDEIRRMAAASRVALLFDTEVVGLAAALGGDAGAVAVTLSSAGVAIRPGVVEGAAAALPSGATEGAVARPAVLPGGPRILPFDAVLVLIGSIPPWSTLREAGIRPVLEAPGGDRPSLSHVEGGTPAGGPP